MHGAICLLAAGWTLLDELDGIVTPGDLTVLIATGTHRGNTPAELGEMLGAELAARLRVINQDARDESMLTWRGVHGDGVPVWLNRHWADADVKITTGFVEPYFFAGFSGGPKLVAPGLGAWRPRRPCTTPELLLLRRAVGHGQPDRQESHQVQAMAHLRLSRLRTGATGWGLYQDGQDPRLFIELFGVPSWEEHLRQHRERQTGTDLQYHGDAAALSDPPPQTGHYFAADLDQ